MRIRRGSKRAERRARKSLHGRQRKPGEPARRTEAMEGAGPEKNPAGTEQSISCMFQLMLNTSSL